MQVRHKTDWLTWQELPPFLGSFLIWGFNSLAHCLFLLNTVVVNPRAKCSKAFLEDTVKTNCFRHKILPPLPASVSRTHVWAPLLGMCLKSKMEESICINLQNQSHPLRSVFSPFQHNLEGTIGSFCPFIHIRPLGDGLGEEQLERSGVRCCRAVRWGWNAVGC